MKYADVPLNEKVDAAVREYCDTISSFIKAMDPDVAFEIDYEYILDEEEKQKATLADIQSPYGFVTIFPDFNKNSAKAALFNRGLVMAMELEGFDDDTIDSAPAHSDLLPFTIENAETFAVVLTSDLGLQHQKLLLEE